MQQKEHSTRPCSMCQMEVIDVRDKFTGATYPVDAQPLTATGLVLEPPTENRRNPWADRGQLYTPHHLSCAGPQEEEESRADALPVGPFEDPDPAVPEEEGAG